MSLRDRVSAFCLANISKPAEDRPIYQELLKGKARKILELGVGLGERSARLIETTARSFDPREIHYTGIDLFEARDADQGPGLSLKAAHRKLTPTGAHVRLVPGDAFSGIAQVANALGQVDLVVISGCQDRALLDQAWFYFPRMIHAATPVFVQKPCRSDEVAAYALIESDEIAIWAGRTQRRRAA
jgi:hypothetical protein